MLSLKGSQMTKNYESGRSMVEMLGTLAIMGVLSIGGIAGYSYGMDKYRANEALKDVNLRVIDLLTQASQGRPALSFAEWENEDSIYDFTNPTYIEGENLIAFDIGSTKKLPKSVCQMVFDGVANTAVQIDINAVHSNSNDNCGEDNTLTLYFEGGGTGTTDTGGETGEQCGDTVCGTCQKCDSATETCVTVGDYKMTCTTGGQSGWCVSGSCEPNTTCNCGPNQYCEVKRIYGACEPTFTGQCIDIKYETEEIDGVIYYVTQHGPSWWEAVLICKALGNKRLLSISDLINDFDKTNTSSQFTSKTALGEKLRNQLGLNYIMTNDTRDCEAYHVDLEWASVALNGLDSGGYKVICR